MLHGPQDGHLGPGRPLANASPDKGRLDAAPGHALHRRVGELTPRAHQQPPGKGVGVRAVGPIVLAHNRMDSFRPPGRLPRQYLQWSGKTRSDRHATTLLEHLNPVNGNGWHDIDKATAEQTRRAALVERRVADSPITPPRSSGRDRAKSPCRAGCARSRRPRRGRVQSARASAPRSGRACPTAGSTPALT